MGERIVGRRRELDALLSWLDAIRTGAGRLVLCAGEPGIGKTRLAQELAGVALARGGAVAWGRCVEAEGAPAFWPWHQVLRSLGTDPDSVLAGDAESPTDRFRAFDEISEAARRASGTNGLVVILDDIHWADEPSLLVLRHLARDVATSKLLVLATFRDVEPGGALPRILPDLLVSPGAERIDLRGFGLAEVRDQLPGSAVGQAGAVLELTGGNPLFVREVARAIAEGTWQPDRPPRTVLDVVAGRLDRVSAACRRLVQAAAIVGRDFPLAVAAAALGEPIDAALPLVDEAVAHGLVERVGGTPEYRFVHALTREAVETSLTMAGRVELHRAVAEALTAHYAGHLSDHLADVARHWAELAPYGEAAAARAWAIRAAEDAVRRLAYEEGVRLYRAALAFPTPTAPPAAEHCRVLIALGRAAYGAGDIEACLDAAVAAGDVARTTGSPELLAEAALVLEAVPDLRVNAVAKELCDEALAGLGHTGDDALRARLLAQRSHLAFYDGDQDRTQSLSRAALDLARQAGDDRALVDALRARQEACPGPAGRAERLVLADEMLAAAPRTNSARSAMWGRLWRIAALLESGRLAAADDELPALQVAVARVGGPVSAWHLDRTAACIAQAQGRYADAAVVSRRAFDRMRVIEPAPATGAYFALQCSLALHVGVSDDAAAFARTQFESPPRFRTMARLSRAVICLCAGLPDEAAASYQQAGPIDRWSLPVFFVLPGLVYATLAAIDLGRHDDVGVLVDRLAQYHGEHVAGEGVAYLGPVELALGRGAAALGRLDQAVDELTDAAEAADRAGAPGFLAEARYHLATTLLARNNPGDPDRAVQVARDAEGLVRSLGMTAYLDRVRALVAQGGGPRRTASLSARESEVASLVAEGLTNRQVADRLVISERTAENHVQHILTKLGFATRSQIAAWVVGGRMSTGMSTRPDVGRTADP